TGAGLPTKRRAWATLLAPMTRPWRTGPTHWQTTCYRKLGRRNRDPHPHPTGPSHRGGLTHVRSHTMTARRLLVFAALVAYLIITGVRDWVRSLDHAHLGVIE